MPLDKDVSFMLSSPRFMIKKGEKISEGGREMLWGKQDEFDLGLSTYLFINIDKSLLILFMAQSEIHLCPDFRVAQIIKN